MQQLAGDGAGLHLQIWDRRRRRRRICLPKKDSQQLLRDFCWRLSKRVFVFLCVRGGELQWGGSCFLQQRSRKRLGACTSFLIFCFFMPWSRHPRQGRGVGITAVLIRQRTSGSLYSPTSRHQRTVYSGHFPPQNQTIGKCRVFKKRGRINSTRQHPKGRPVPGISKKEGQNQQNWRFRVFPNSSTNPTWFSFLTSQNK